MQTTQALEELHREEAEALGTSELASRLQVAATAEPETWVPCARRGGSTVDDALKIALHATKAPLPPLEPVRKQCDKASFFDADRLTLQVAPRPAARPSSGTTRMAALWRDSGMHASRVKLARAEIAEWREEQAKWKRSQSLRRQLLVEEEERKAAAEARQQRALSRLNARMRQWHLEDSTAVALQDAWRVQMARQAMKMQREVAAAMAVLSGQTVGQEGVSAIHKQETFVLRKQATYNRGAPMGMSAAKQAAEEREKAALVIQRNVKRPSAGREEVPTWA